MAFSSTFKIVNPITKTFMGQSHQARCLAVEAMAGHAIGSVCGAALSHGFQYGEVNALTAAPACSIVGTMVFSGVFGDASAITSMGLAAAGIGGQFASLVTSDYLPGFYTSLDDTEIFVLVLFGGIAGVGTACLLVE